ncbi:uncharacterized protein RAG0_04369 [Rhynchosporium agropyri]|uniref:Uncharacterized protein n=1 Tax=Rhynchosporium agropyri TaxID=914238 RepID=A0A1E1K8C1_9HELO|nr:uncharacterized protein RAG0_04369 [Rhynchosporium agropyri]
MTKVVTPTAQYMPTGTTCSAIRVSLLLESAMFFISRGSSIDIVRSYSEYFGRISISTASTSANASLRGCGKTRIQHFLYYSKWNDQSLTLGVGATYHPTLHALSLKGQLQ